MSPKQDYYNRIEHAIKTRIDRSIIPATRIKDALNYSLFPGGKRLRPLLVYLSGELVGASSDSLDIIAVSIELMHCYSLVHDDLPAMDNDDYRRGKPSCHKAFDEATAILVGDGLQSLALEILVNDLSLHIPAERVLSVASKLLTATGFNGMISGQSLDLTELVKPSLTASELYTIHGLKTGRLISACIECVVAAYCPSLAIEDALKQSAQELGIAFQMQDDYLDAFGSTHCLGKNRSSDIANNKMTFARLYDARTLLNHVNYHFDNAKQALSGLGVNATALINFIAQLQHRSSSKD